MDLKYNTNNIFLETATMILSRLIISSYVLLQFQNITNYYMIHVKKVIKIMVCMS